MGLVGFGQVWLGLVCWVWSGLVRFDWVWLGFGTHPFDPVEKRGTVGKRGSRGKRGLVVL